jgi:hypothetical protein
MKKVMFILLAIFAVQTTVCQNTKTFVSQRGHFSFSYPSYLKSEKINNAPHMLLKLNSENYSLTLGLWEEYDFDQITSIWDDDVVNAFLETDSYISKSKNDILCQKKYLTTQSGKLKFLKSIYNQTVSNGTESIRMKNIMYRIIHKGKYLQFSFFVFEFQSYWNKSNFTDTIMEGLKLL